MTQGNNKSQDKTSPKPGQTRVLVAGATGYLGGLAVEECKRQGYWVRALARDAGRLKVKHLCDDVFVGQATDYRTLNGMCDGIDVVFTSVGFMTFNKKPPIWEVDYNANINILKQAKDSGVKHFIFTSTVGCKEMAKTVRIAQAKQAVAKALEASGMRWTVMEPTGFFDDMRKLYDHAKKRGSASVFGTGKTTLNPIHGIDLATASINAIKDQSMWNKYVPIGGPDDFTHEEISTLCLEILGKPVKIKHIPLWVLKAISGIARPFNANLADMIWFFIAMGSMNLSAPPFGNHRLKDFFISLKNNEK